MIILGRECGLAIEMDQVKVQSLVPDQVSSVESAEDFMLALPQVIVHGHPSSSTCHSLLSRFMKVCEPRLAV